MEIYQRGFIYLNGHTKGKMKMKTTRHVSVVVYTGSNMFQ